MQSSLTPESIIISTALEQSRYIMVLVSNESIDHARESIEENPDAVQVCYNVSNKFETTNGRYDFAVLVDTNGDEITSHKRVREVYGN